MSSTTNPGSSDSTARRLTIVIVTWNVRDYLGDCLRSLQIAGVPGWAEVVVVDNASTDGSADMVAREFPFATLVRSEVNLGFTRGNNLAMRSAATSYVLLLNPDTLVPPGALEALVSAMDDDPSLGVSGPRQLDRDGRTQLEGAVAQPTVWNALCDLALLSRFFPTSRLFSRRTMGWWDHADDRDVPGIAGSAMLLRRAALDRVGLLDETMFCAEDMDLCRRIRTAGWRVRYFGSVAITHFGGASIKRSDAALQRQIAYQSFWLYLRKHDGRVTAGLMTVGVVTISLAGWIATGVLGLIPGWPAGAAETLRKYRRLAAALMQWGVMDKRQFRHALAAPPSIPAPTLASAIDPSGRSTP
ncbi:MAG TPA: glycosyltransferase family 2 protein [Vicinamibacterales bacterium]|nr:glycosyltransferase family 2 protein [Vicinamibacterales bacterium]